MSALRSAAARGPGPRPCARGRAAAAVRLAGLALILGTGALLAPATASAQQDTVRVDTAAADTVPSARERALRRLRALPATPVQRDTIGADTLPADTAAADTLAPGPGGGRIVVADTVPEPDDGAEAAAVLALLRGLEGYAITEYEGERAEFDAEGNRLRLLGRSRVGRGRNALSTDSLLVYSGGAGVVCGYGNPVLEGERDPVESARVCYDVERDLGMAEGARTQFEQGATWYVRGDDNRVYLLTEGDHKELYGHKTDFTSCDLPHPHYTFRAQSLKMAENDVMIARDVTLRFDDVPVFWLPWMVQSMKRGRRSGLLMPQFGVNDIVRNQSGYNRHISDLGFYWAINDYMSARGTFEWFSNNWTAVQGAFTYRWLRQFLNGGGTFTHYWREGGRQDLTIATNNSWRPDERTSLSLSGTYASSSEFVRRNSFDPRELNRQIAMNASANRSFGWGSVTTGASRTQYLSDDRVVMKLPSVGLSVSPMTLYSSPTGATSLTWNANADVTRQSVDVQETLPGARFRDTESLSASASHRIGFGRFSVSQRAGYTEDILGFKPAIAPPPDLPGEEPEPELPRTATQRLVWSTSASYQQDLWAGTSVTPTATVTGGSLRGDTTGGAVVQEPLRMSFGAGLNTSVYGFWPGVGPFSRIRHKISPQLSWAYSPAPAGVSLLQDRVFGSRNLTEQNRLTLSFNQTFEAKYTEPDTAAGPGAGAAGAGAAVPGAGAAAEGDAVGDPSGGVGETGAGEPRRLPQVRKVTLLAVNTGTSFLYDLVARDREGRGFLTDQVSNSIRSDLLRGFQLTTTHDLFREGEPPVAPFRPLPIPDVAEVATPLEPRSFDPFLTRLSARFEIDQGFWLFRTLGLTGAPAADTAVDGPGRDDGESAGTGAAADPSMGAEALPGDVPGSVGSIVNGSGAGERRSRQGVGGWRAALNYSLSRSRPGESRAGDNQMVRGDFSFQPTEYWNVRWSTSYSFTDARFADNVLSLSRDLHRWQASFDFIRAQNGNFYFSFRVHLIDNPDLELDYDQRTDPARSGLRPGQR